MAGLHQSSQGRTQRWGAGADQQGGAALSTEGHANKAGTAWDSPHQKQLRAQAEAEGRAHAARSRPGLGDVARPAVGLARGPSGAWAAPALSPGACSETGWGEDAEEDDTCGSPLFPGAGVQLLQSLHQLRNTPNKRQLSTVRDGDSSDEERGARGY